ncbi:MAG: hypothetical protein HYS17_05050 [Micavibrio aeruginosavorus]|uniref:Uncharacterized protein n=1 Tax=Micavibrio aeruginosavorus TaxID=349221 RepID=A0A7T5UIM2_9BACT|nr:MAG: hypothetical protein HYS17_05050 [Micavibrio aeruginosavorus]
MTSQILVKLKGHDVLDTAHAAYRVLDMMGVHNIHCTNGTYAYPVERTVPTTLAGFQYINDQVASPYDAFLVAVNSNQSMAGIMAAKNATAAEMSALESEDVRAAKVADALSAHFNNRPVVVLFYHEDTPTRLYEALAAANINLVSLHKWGYGTDPKAPRIEGASNFARVFGFPLPNDGKPVCHGITVREDQSGVVTVVKLQEQLGPHGKPYISSAGKVQFTVPAGLQIHQDLSALNMPAPANAPSMKP